MRAARQLRVACISVLVAVLILGYASPTFAYLKFGFEVSGRQVAVKWARTPIRYFVNDQPGNGVSAAEFQRAVSRAFSTWQAVPTSSITYSFAGPTTALPGDDDNRSTLGFLDEPDLERVLASTNFLVDEVTGEILEADIFFNSAFQWSVAENGERNRWDVETIALHEIGHLSGLGHSALGETEMLNGGRHVISTGAIMFPIAIGPGDISGRQLDADDVAGISDLYPDNNFSDTTGSVSGRVTKNGRGVFGAHVVAFDSATGNLVGNFTLSTNGEFSIAGLRPGPYAIRVEPLDDADTASFFDPGEPVDINFRTKYFESLVIVPRGGDSGSIRVAVVP